VTNPMRRPRREPFLPKFEADDVIAPVFDPRVVEIMRRGEMMPPYRYRVVTEDPQYLGELTQNGTTVVKGRTNLTTKEIMRVVDNLPKRVRDAYHTSVHDWAPHWAKLVLRYFPEADVIERLKRADREEAQRREVQLLMRKG